MNILRAEGLSKSFGGIRAVQNATVAVEKGTITGLIGPNGSGKTTLFNLMTGIYQPDSGDVYLNGRKVTGVRSNHLCHAGLSRTFQITRLFWEMSVLENMVVPVRQVGFKSLFSAGMFAHEEERAMALLKRVGIDFLAHEPAKKLSFGQQKLLEFAAVLMSEPDIVLLDEPAGGVNPTMIRFIMDLIQELNAEGVTFLVVEHNMGVVMELCEHILVLDQGTKIAEGAPEAVQNNQAVLEAYLGH